VDGPALPVGMEDRRARELRSQHGLRSPALPARRSTRRRAGSAVRARGLPSRSRCRFAPWAPRLTRSRRQLLRSP
jgi:hypothetical protein